MALIPRKIIVGDSLYFKFNTGNAPDGTSITDTNGFTLYLKLRGPCDIDITATADGGSTWIINVPSTTTTEWVDGLYQYVLYADKGESPFTDSWTIETGKVELVDRADKATSPTTEPVSYYKRIFDAITAVLENRATKDQESMSIANRSLSRTPIDDLLRLHGWAKDNYERELNKSFAAKNKLKIRM